MHNVVLDTNVLYSAMRSQGGASFKLLSLLGKGSYEISVSVPLVVEYEDALMRLAGNGKLRKSDIEAVLDFVCAQANHQSIFFLWRPLLRDPKDDHVAEVAVAAGCSSVVTYNLKDFKPLEQFDLRIITPSILLGEIGET